MVAVRYVGIVGKVKATRALQAAMAAAGISDESLTAPTNHGWLTAWLRENEPGEKQGSLGLINGARAVLSRYEPTDVSRLTIECLVPQDKSMASVVAIIADVAGTLLADQLVSVDVTSRTVDVPTFMPISPFVVGPAMAEVVELASTPDEIVVADVMLGANPPRNALARLAAEAGAPTLTVIEGENVWEQGTAPDTGAYLGQLAVGLQPYPRVKYADLLAAHLVVASEPRRPTRAAVRYLEASGWTVGGTYSAVATLLRSRPDGLALGVELERLTRRWVELRVFDCSLVTEMVLHDQSHALSVDRNVAILVAPLLDEEKLTPSDVFRLGCAAWLHDCGHSSTVLHGEDGERVPAEPEFVRSFHGPLGARRITELAGELGLKTDDVPWVAALAGHHQGWTSVSGNPHRVEPDAAEEALRTDQDRKFADGLTRTLGETLDEGGLGTDDLERAQRLIVLLRVADAMDIGRHRVQHRDLHRTQLDTSIRIYTQRCVDAIAGEPSAELIVRQLRRQERTLIDRFRDGATKVDENFAGAIDDAVNEMTASVDVAVRNRVKLWTHRVVAYYRYILDQAKHFDKHDAVRTVIPVVSTTEVGHQLTLHVLPAHSGDEVALQPVQADVAKELGVIIGDATEEERSAVAARTAPLVAAWKKLGYVVNIEGAPVEALEPPWWSNRSAQVLPPESAAVEWVVGDHEKGAEGVYAL